MECDSRTDDIFANSSTETVKEISAEGNVEIMNRDDILCPTGLTKEGMEKNTNSRRMDDDSFIALHVIEGYCKPSQKVYCPFCPMSYTSDSLLKSHLKDFHAPHLNLIFNEESHPIMFQSCTLCHATFYAKGLLPLHFLRVHENALVGLMNCRNVKHDGFLYCMYCRFTVVKSNAKTLMLHLEKMHFPDFERFILGNCTSKVHAKEALSSLHEKQKFIHYSSSLNRPRRRALLSSNGVNSSARRKLDFNAIEEKHVRKIRFKDLKRQNVNKEGSVSIVSLKKKTSKWLFFKKFHIKSKANTVFTSTPNCNTSSHNESESDFMQFRCASCHHTFRDNKKLLNHVSHCHKWPWNRLRPCYSCGFCDATFYRNSFLVRHTINHHTPKCLRSELDD